MSIVLPLLFYWVNVGLCGCNFEIVFASRRPMTPFYLREVLCEIDCTFESFIYFVLLNFSIKAMHCSNNVTPSGDGMLSC